MAREARGFAREQAAKSSNIPGYYLTMIETDDYSSIADQLYLLPFLRRYATFVGLEPEEVASRFIRDVQRADMNPGRVSEPIEMFAPRKPLPWGAIMTIAAAIVVAAGGWFGYRYYAARKSARASSQAPIAVVPVVPMAEQAAPKSADTAPAKLEASPIAVPPAAVAPGANPSAADPAAAVPPAMVSPAAVSPATVPPAVPHPAASASLRDHPNRSCTRPLRLLRLHLHDRQHTREFPVSRHQLRVVCQCRIELAISSATGSFAVWRWSRGWTTTTRHPARQRRANVALRFLSIIHAFSL